MADDLGDDWWQKSSKSKLNVKDKKKRKREGLIFLINIFYNRFSLSNLAYLQNFVFIEH